MATSAAESTLKAILCVSTSDPASVVLTLFHAEQKGGLCLILGRIPKCKIHSWFNRDVSRRANGDLLCFCGRSCCRSPFKSSWGPSFPCSCSGTALVTCLGLKLTAISKKNVCSPVHLPLIFYSLLWFFVNYRSHDICNFPTKFHGLLHVLAEILSSYITFSCEFLLRLLSSWNTTADSFSRIPQQEASIFHYIC